MASDDRWFLVSVSTRSTVVKADSEAIVRVMMESIGYVNSCDFR